MLEDSEIILLTTTGELWNSESDIAVNEQTDSCDMIRGVIRRGTKPKGGGAILLSKYFHQVWIKFHYSLYSNIEEFQSSNFTIKPFSYAHHKTKRKIS